MVMELLLLNSSVLTTRRLVRHRIVFKKTNFIGLAGDARSISVALTRPVFHWRHREWNDSQLSSGFDLPLAALKWVAAQWRLDSDGDRQPQGEIQIRKII